MVTVAVSVAGCVDEDNPCAPEGYTCNPPEPDCPFNMPVVGESCDQQEPGDCYFTDACDNQVRFRCTGGTWSETSDVVCDEPPEPTGPGTCSSAIPIAGDACTQEVSGCTYEDDCGSTVTASCNGLSWEVEGPAEACNPPPPCPRDLPDEASPCELTPGGTPIGCAYAVETACGPAQADAACVVSKATGDYVWAVSTPICEPEEPNCSGYSNGGVCAADTTCRWLVPGCTDEGGESFSPGCFPIAECDLVPGSCGPTAACVALTYDPCWNSTCGSCGAETTACLGTFTAD